MNRDKIVESIKEHKLIAIIRLNDSEHTIPVLEAIYEGGIRTIEVTATTPKALEAVAYFAKKGPSDLLIGVGSVVDKETAKKFIDAGAKYIVTPATQREVILEAHKYDVPVVSGAFTPSEVIEAYQLGCGLIKIFPAEFLGAKYIKAIKAPMPYVSLAPTGGVSLENMHDWFDNGASALGIGSSMLKGFNPDEKNYDQVAKNAKEFYLKSKAYK
ncbi:MAG: bifunctional 4-hydroxy-2-oxoglutarate aldolase/2-dehydro-3-deoxy-phosphogluconate aldolase [Flavobacteriales bacterium]|nr:bifunctional 4-hydroxy-2-oxoglutarate aldolase/2-dehydro-3-deoxy-phosphogluconate aldolase [Flavobacteriales bacterium]